MINKLLPPVQKISTAVRRYAVILCIVIFGGLSGYLIYTAGQQAEIEPSEAEIGEAYKGVSRPRLDATTGDKLKSLESSNVDVQAIFNEARNNPFSE